MQSRDSVRVSIWIVKIFLLSKLTFLLGLKFKKMEPLEANHVLIKRLLARKSDLKLAHNVRFVFNLYAGQCAHSVEMSAEKMIAAVDNKRFAQVFDVSLKQESTPTIRVFAIEPEEFINLLRSVFLFWLVFNSDSEFQSA